MSLKDFEEEADFDEAVEKTATIILDSKYLSIFQGNIERFIIL